MGLQLRVIRSEGGDVVDHSWMVTVVAMCDVIRVSLWGGGGPWSTTAYLCPQYRQSVNSFLFLHYIQIPILLQYYLRIDDQLIFFLFSFLYINLAEELAVRDLTPLPFLKVSRIGQQA